MKVKKVLVLGASRYYASCINGAREAGYHVIAVDRNEDSEGFLYANESEVCDIVDKEGILEIARKHRVSAVIPVNDYGVITASYVSEKMGFSRYIPSEVAILATNKEAMRCRWSQMRVPCPKVEVVEDESELRTAILRVGLPCILKPAHGIGGASRGVVVIKKEDEISNAIAFSQQFYDDKTTLVESFVEAISEHSVEALIIDGFVNIIAISDKIKTELPYRVDKAVLYPSSANGETLIQLKEIVTEAILALGLRDGAAHVELALTHNGFVLFELGARCGGGGTANPIVKYSTGIDEFTEFVRILAGDEPKCLVPNKSLGSCYYFITPKPGKVRDVSGIDKIRSNSNVLEADVFIKHGTEIRNVTIGTERSGFIISVGESARDALNHAIKAESQLVIDYDE